MFLKSQIELYYLEQQETLNLMLEGNNLRTITLATRIVRIGKRSPKWRWLKDKDFDCVDHNKLWKILKEMGIPDRLTCLLRNLYAGQEATVRTGHGTTDWFQIGKGVRQGCILSPSLFNLYAE